MPPTDRFVISFAAEPPQESLPYGRWADTLRDHFLAACRQIEAGGEDLARPHSAETHPDRVSPASRASPARPRPLGASIARRYRAIPQRVAAT